MFINKKTLCIGIAALPFICLQVPVLSVITQSPVFTYITGPRNCSQPSDYLDEAVCTITGEVPLAQFRLPKRGGQYQDSNFGNTVRILTGFGSNHGYSSPSAFSANGRYVAVAEGDNQVNVVETSSGKTAYVNQPGNVTSDTIRWDAVNDDVYYFIQGGSVRQHTLSSHQTQTVATLPFNINGGGTGDISGDNWFAFWSGDARTVCALNLNSRMTYCAPYSKSVSVDFVNISKGVDSGTGKRYVLLMSNPAIQVYSVNERTGKLDFEFSGPKLGAEFQGAGQYLGSWHSDTFADAAGRQYLMFVADMETPCARVVQSALISKGASMMKPMAQGGGRTDIMTLHRCGGGPLELWTENHTGCAKRAPYCVVSTNYTNARSPKDLTTPIRRTTHLSELIVIRNNGEEIRRLAQTRGIQFSDDTYWSLARASISSDGSAVAWDSNFGYPGKGEVVAMAFTGFGGTPNPAPPPGPAPAPNPGPSPSPAPSPAPAPLTIATAGLPAGKAGALYSHSLLGSGGAQPYTWSMYGGSLPSGLTLNKHGVISGIPAVGGSFAITVRLKDSKGASVTARLNLIVTAVVKPTAITSVTSTGGQAAISPGGWMTISGTNLTSTSRHWRTDEFLDGRLPTQMDGIQVLVNGRPAYLSYISPVSITAQAPNDPAIGAVQLVISKNGVSSASTFVSIQQSTPSFLTWPGGYAVATHSNFAPAVKQGVLSSAKTTPAKPGELILLWGTGFGATQPWFPAGQVVRPGKLYKMTATPKITIGGVRAEFVHGALSPGSAGLYQLAIRVPATVPIGNLPVTVEMGSSSPTVTTKLTVER